MAASTLTRLPTKWRLLLNNRQWCFGLQLVPKLIQSKLTQRWRRVLLKLRISTPTFSLQKNNSNSKPTLHNGHSRDNNSRALSCAPLIGLLTVALSTVVSSIQLPITSYHLASFQFALSPPIQANPSQAKLNRTDPFRCMECASILGMLWPCGLMLAPYIFQPSSA